MTFYDDPDLFTADSSLRLNIHRLRLLAENAPDPGDCPFQRVVSVIGLYLDQIEVALDEDVPSPYQLAVLEMQSIVDDRRRKAISAREAIMRLDEVLHTHGAFTTAGGSGCAANQNCRQDVSRP